MDRNGIPIAFDLLAGNESEKLHMLPAIRRMKQQYTDQRLILVADRGLNTSDNIYYLNGDNKAEKNPKDGYVYGQSVCWSICWKQNLETGILPARLWNPYATTIVCRLILIFTSFFPIMKFWKSVER